MKREDVIKNMDEAFREDRERFFKVADSLALQPKYKEHLEELETLKQTWRDIPATEGYPNIDHPMKLPDWFPTVHFASSWQKDKFIEEMAENNETSEVEEATEESGSDNN